MSPGPTFSASGNSSVKKHTGSSPAEHQIESKRSQRIPRYDSILLKDSVRLQAARDIQIYSSDILIRKLRANLVIFATRRQVLEFYGCQKHLSVINTFIGIFPYIAVSLFNSSNIRIFEDKSRIRFDESMKTYGLTN